MKKRKYTNKSKVIVPKSKGYDTYINKDGVKCITNFNPYNMKRCLTTSSPIMSEVNVKVDLL